MRKRHVIFSALLLLMPGALWLSFAVPPVKTDSAELRAVEESLARDWGVKVQGLRLTAGGYMLDFRYSITDPAKANALMDRSLRPVLEHEATGAKLMVPNPPKVGPLRSVTRNANPLPGKSYFVIFANPGKMVKSGDKVSVRIGEFEVKHLTAT